MSRTVKHSADALPDTPVADTPVAPHRYLWDGDEPEPADPSYSAWKLTVPYRVGEVVYVDRNGVPARARILYVLGDRTRAGDRIAKFRVQLATKAGKWSKVWVYVWPGHIQRGYVLAGLAPDVPPRVGRAWGAR